MRPTVGNVCLAAIVSAVLYAFVGANGVLLIAELAEGAAEEPVLWWAAGIPIALVVGLLAGAGLHGRLRLSRVRRAFPDWYILPAVPRRPLRESLGVIMNDAGYEFPHVQYWDLYLAVKGDRLGLLRSRDPSLLAEFPAERIEVEVGMAVDWFTLLPVSRITFDEYPPVVLGLPVVGLSGFAQHSRKYHRSLYDRAGLPLVPRARTKH